MSFGAREVSFGRLALHALSIFAVFVGVVSRPALSLLLDKASELLVRARKRWPESSVYLAQFRVGRLLLRPGFEGPSDRAGHRGRCLGKAPEPAASRGGRDCRAERGRLLARRAMDGNVRGIGP